MERPCVLTRVCLAPLGVALALFISGCGGTSESPETSSDTVSRPILTPEDTRTPQDIGSPTVVITSPTTGTSYQSTGATVTLAGSASDDVGVVRVVWSNNRGGSGTASGTTSWSTGAIALETGVNVITVTAVDARDNSGTASISVSYGTISPGDTTPPSVTISSPTTSASYVTTGATVSLSGTSGDNVGVTRVTWSNNRGGSGTASGTNSWSAAGIPLQSGSNVITVTAVDAASNAATDVLTVTYNAPDTSAPSVAITSPTTGATHTTTGATIAIGGTASDNVGVVRVTWSNSRGGSGTASGTSSWSVTGIALQSGNNVITVTAVDAANNAASDTLTVVYETSTAGGVTLAWDSPSAEANQACPAQLSGYKVYMGTAPGVYSITQTLPVNGLSCSSTGQSGSCGPIQTCSYRISGLAAGTWYFAVTAYDSAGSESVFSNTAAHTVN